MDGKVVYQIEALSQIEEQIEQRMDACRNCKVQQQTRQKLRAFSPYGCERNRKYQRHELGIHVDRNGVNTQIFKNRTR